MVLRRSTYSTAASQTDPKHRPSRGSPEPSHVMQLGPSRNSLSRPHAAQRSRADMDAARRGKYTLLFAFASRAVRVFASYLLSDPGSIGRRCGIAAYSPPLSSLFMSIPPPTLLRVTTDARSIQGPPKLMGRERSPIHPPPIGRGVSTYPGSSPLFLLVVIGHWYGPTYQ